MTYVSDISISAKVEVSPYCFEPVTCDSEFIGYGGKVVHAELDNLSPEQVGNTD